MIVHVLDVAWQCLGCGGRVPAGEAAYRQGDAWRCGPCAYGRQRRPEPPRTSRQRPPPYDPPGMPRFGNREKSHVRKAKGTTLEELLNAW